MLPTIQEYKDSFRNPSEYFKNLQLGFIPSKFDENDPYFIAGGFACVFKVQQQNEFWAFKCFLQDDPHRNERLEILSDFLKNRTETYFLPTHYYTDELWVCSNLGGDAEYPTLAMKWVEGLTLGEYVHKAAKDKNTQKLTAIYEAFLRLAHFLLSNDFAHGDLKHDNILVDTDENLILIDYDGMYLPSLTAFPSPELGGHGYQHPKRTAQDWGRHIDDFSILVILLSLRAYILLPSLIDDHKNENLLLTSEDLQNPMQSKPLQTLWQQNDEPLKHLLGMLLNSLAQNNLRVLEIGAFVERNLFDVLLLFYDRNKNKKEFIFDIHWWNGLDKKWKDIFKWLVNGNKNEQSFFENISNLESLPLNGQITNTYIDIYIDFLPDSIGNLAKLSRIDLEIQNITELPESIGNLVSLIELDVSRNKLTSLPESIGNLVNLTELNLGGNLLTSLPESIGKLINLKELDLRNNILTLLPNTLGELVNLEKLYLNNNCLTLLPESIRKLKNLTYLSLYGNSLSNSETEKIREVLPNCNVQDNFFNMEWWNGLDDVWKNMFRRAINMKENEVNFFNKISNITILKDWEISLKGYPTNVLPASIGNLVRLTYLNLSYDLVSLPESIGNLINLSELNLNSNKLKFLPKSIGHLTNLTELRLYDNCLVKLPESIGALINLNKLNLGNNKIVSLPQEIGNLINLSELQLSDNPLIFLPESIGNLKKLKKFSLQGNDLLRNGKIEILPKNIGNLTSLNYLHLDWNKLIELPNTIGGLKNLIELSLKYNQLILLPESIGDLNKLTKLILNNNKLNFLPESIGNLINLTELDLSYNKLATLPESIGNLTNLTKLYLGDNQITSLPESIGNLTNLQELYLGTNPISSSEKERIQKILPNCNVRTPY